MPKLCTIKQGKKRFYHPLKINKLPSIPEWKIPRPNQ
jgi:hypothetical protein